MLGHYWIGQLQGGLKGLDQNCLFSKGFLIIDQSIARDFSSCSLPIQTLTERNKAFIEPALWAIALISSILTGRYRRSDVNPEVFILLFSSAFAVSKNR